MCELVIARNATDALFEGEAVQDSPPTPSSFAPNEVNRTLQAGLGTFEADLPALAWQIRQAAERTAGS